MNVKNFVLAVFATLFSINIVGCETQNPICNDLFCVDGRIFSRAEIGDAEFEEVNVDTTNLLAALEEIPSTDIEAITTPNLPTGVTSVDLKTIVADVASGGTSYEDTWVYLEGLVTVDLTDGGRSLMLETGNDSVLFRVSSLVKVSQLTRWTKGNRYGFILLISDIQYNADTGIMTIFSRVDDPDNIAKGKSVFTPSPSAVLAVSTDILFQGFRRGESYYIGKRVSFLATIEARSEDQTSTSSGAVYDRLSIAGENPNLFSVGRDSIGIYQTMQLFEGDIDPKYTKGSLHHFEVTIHYLSGQDFFDEDKVSIVAYFEDKTFLP